MLEWLLGKSFEPAKDIPDLSGKVILVTGGNVGLGKETVLQLALHHPRHIYLAARTKAKALAAIVDIQEAVPGVEISFLPLDLTSFESVRAAAKEFSSRSQRLNILINNAGVMVLPYSKTTEGYEIQFGTNHMGHALFTKLLLPTLLKTAEEPDADVRVINVSSMGHALAPRCGIVYDQDALEQYQTLQRYGQSKLANILHAKELQRRYPSITATAIHPGVIFTDLYGSAKQSIPLGNYLFALGGTTARMLGLAYDVPNGAKNTLWVATASKDEVRSSPFWRPVGIKQANYLHSGKPNLAQELWDWTEHQFLQLGY